MAEFLLVCLTQLDIDNGKCDVYCRTKMGYDSGHYSNQQCVCERKIGFEELSNPVMILKSRAGKIKEESKRISIWDE